MQDNFALKLTTALSPARLDAYRQRLANVDELKLFSHYAWNMSLSESLYSSLQTLEVTLRNSIHTAAAEYFGRSNWFDDQKIIRSQNDVMAIAKSKKTLVMQKKPLESGRIVAELNFGFWTALLDRRYEQILWPTLLRKSFPCIPRSLRTRENLSRRFQKIRRLRNRVFHHEPIWHWSDLEQHHADILEAVFWIEPAARDFIAAIDKFPTIFRNGLSSIEKKLEHLI